MKPYWQETHPDTTDRGWLVNGCTTSLGFFMSYPGEGPEGENVLAVKIAHDAKPGRPCGGSLKSFCRTHDTVRWFETIEQARAWLEAKEASQVPA